MNASELMKNFAVNIERERDKKGMTQEEFAKKLGISKSTYKNIISRRVNTLNVGIVPNVYDLTGRFAAELFGIHNRELDMLQKYRRLNERQQAYIDLLLDYEIGLLESGTPTERYMDIIVPTGNMEDGMIIDSAYKERIPFPQFMQQFEKEAVCGIRITSNHLHPVYVLGDVLAISRRPPRDGDTAIFINTDSRRAYCRKFHQGKPCRLVPVNQYGTTFEVDPNNCEDMRHWIKFGVVISVLR